MAGRRGNSEGTIRKREADGRWEARFVDVDGKRRSIYGKTRQEVARLLTTALRDREQGMTAYTDRQTLAQYLPSWLEKVRHQVKASTYMKYETAVRLRLLPGLGKIALTKLTSQRVQDFYSRKLAEGMSGSAVSNMHGVLSHALQDALRLGLVHRNVCTVVDLPRLVHREIHPLTEEQARVFLEAVAGDRFESLYILALSTGMRRGELLALRWADMDLEKAAIQVAANIQRMPDGWKMDRTKTRHSRRRIALTPTAVTALRQHRLRQAEERLRLGPVWADLDLVFPDLAGKIQNPISFVDKRFKPLLKKAGLPNIRFHDLRHTCATLLLGRGVNPKVVSEMLGHATIAITLGMYGHVLPHMQEQAAALMDKMLWGS